MTRKKIEKIGELSFKNAVRLHKDAVILYKKSSFASAYFLSVLALEEIGKVHIVEKMLSWEGDLGEYEQEFLIMLYDHTKKQGYFYNNSYFNDWISGNSKHRSFVEGVWKGLLEKEKHKSVYVGLPKDKRMIDAKGRLTNPMKVDAKKASKQLTLVSDEILSLAFGHIYQIYGIDNEQVTKHFTRSFFNQMQKLWSIKSLKAKRHFKKVVQHFIKEDKPLHII
jgi:AbiV family abortive infection protein